MFIWRESSFRVGLRLFLLLPWPSNSMTPKCSSKRTSFRTDWKSLPSILARTYIEEGLLALIICKIRAFSLLIRERTFETSLKRPSPEKRWNKVEKVPLFSSREMFFIAVRFFCAGIFDIFLLVIIIFLRDFSVFFSAFLSYFYIIYLVVKLITIFKCYSFQIYVF